MSDKVRKPRSGALDAALGQRIRQLRRTRGETQTTLGDKVGLTFQQIQKYENGSNRISALMLVKLARALDTTAADLLSSVEEDGTAASPVEEVTQLVDNFRMINLPELRTAVLRLVSGIVKSQA